MSGYCDLKTGLCGESDQPVEEMILPVDRPKIALLYATDPICSHCWAMEPGWRKLLYHYGDQVSVRHIYGGLLPAWEGFADAANGIRKPADVAPHWAEVARHYGQPINPGVWLTDPLASSYPPSVAAHTVRLLDPSKEEVFLRRMREAIFLEERNIARPEVLAACAAAVGLDPDLFARLLGSGAGKAAFERDLIEVRQLPVRGFPTVIMVGPDGKGLAIGGTQPFARLEEALLRAGRLAARRKRVTAPEALAAYRSGTLPEFAELLEMRPEEAVNALRQAGATARGELWSLNESTM